MYSLPTINAASLQMSDSIVVHAHIVCFFFFFLWFHPHWCNYFYGNNVKKKQNPQDITLECYIPVVVIHVYVYEVSVLHNYVVALLPTQQY